MKINEKNEYKVGDFVLPVSLKYTNQVCELTEDLGYDFKYKTKSGGWGFIVKSYLPTRWRHATGDEITSGIASQIQIVKSFIAEHGLLKAMEVLKNAPEGSTHHDLVTAENIDLYFNSKDHLEWCDLELKWCLPRFHHTNEMIMGMIDIAVLKRIVASVDLVKVGDKVVYTDIQGSCVLTYEGEDNNPFKLHWLSYPDGTTGYIFSLDKIRKATPEEIAAGRRLDHIEDINDMGADSYIENHITRL